MYLIFLPFGILYFPGYGIMDWQLFSFRILKMSNSVFWLSKCMFLSQLLVLVSILWDYFFFSLASFKIFFSLSFILQSFNMIQLVVVSLHSSCLDLCHFLNLWFDDFHKSQKFINYFLFYCFFLILYSPLGHQLQLFRIFCLVLYIFYIFSWFFLPFLFLSVIQYVLTNHLFGLICC